MTSIKLDRINIKQTNQMYKKKTNKIGIANRYVHKLLLIMRFTTIILIAMIMQVSAAGTAQTMSFVKKNTTIKEIFAEIRMQMGFNVVWPAEKFDESKTINVNFKNAPLSIVLDQTLDGQNISYAIKNKTIVLKASRSNELTHQEVISGVITNLIGNEPLKGVTVLLNGTSTATQTDANGRYNIKASKGMLKFSFVGFADTLVNINGRSTINVMMIPTHLKLDEVVVVGYGSVKKRDLTGSVSTVKADVFDQSRQSSFVNSMQGRVAGLQITSGSGEPGSGSKIIIRGANSLTGESRPLFVIDGVPVNESEAPIANSKFGANSRRDPLNSINPADIVSVEVLKDASSTAIYGSRGANGVIIITTRQGKEGESMVTYDGRMGISYPAKRLEMLNGDEWVDYRKDWVLMPDGKRITYGYFNDYLFFTNAGKTEPSEMIPRDVYALPEYNWQDEMYRTAYTKDHNISVTGGTKYTKFFGSVGYNQEDGLFVNNDYSRYNTRLRLDHNKNRFIMSLSINGSYSQYNGAVQSGDGYGNIGVTQAAIISRPLVFENPLALQTQGGWKKPTENLEHIDRNISTPNVGANLSLNYKLIEGLYVGSMLNGVIVNSKVNEFYGKDTPWGYYLKGRAAINNTEWMGWSNINTLSYDKMLKNNSKISALGVFELSGSGYRNSSIIKSNFSDETTGIHDISKGVILEDATSGAGQTKRISYLGRLNYDYRGKYLLTGSMRMDGSDRFGEDNRYGYFPSMAFGWRISEENFMKKQTLFDNLKLRLSYGHTGNSNIPEFQYMARMGNSFYADQFGLVPSSLPNPNLKWETTVQYNAGLDVSVLNKRLDITLDFYDKITTDMLYNAIIPAQSGFKTQWQNLGKINNKGVELAINTKNIVADKFSWNSSLTVSLNRNKVQIIGDNLSVAPVGAGSWSTSYIKQNVVGRIMVNQPIGVMYGYEMIGIYQESDFSGWIDKTGILPENDPNIAWQERNWVLKSGVVDPSAIAKPRPGTFKFRNVDNSEDNRITENDKKIIGNSQPLLFGGFGNSFNYKNFDLNVFITYSLGGEIFNSTKFELEGSSPGEYYNITKKFWDNRWTPLNPTNEYPAYSDEGYYNTLAAQPNSYYVEDASYARLQNVSLAYRLPIRLTKKLGLGSAKIYYSGVNLYTLTKYSGFTPEVDSGNPLLTNFDTIGYPRAATHSLGFNINF
jgi:TonB-linked SusC/RagA family outer membrane protein